MTTLADRLRAAGCVFAEEESVLLSAAADGDQLERLVRRRIAGEPLEQLLGWAEFAGLRIEVAQGVFVPRRRTELLVDLALEHAGSGTVIVELCCGVGAVAAALLERLPGAVVHAADVDPAATVVAARNLRGRGRVWQGDLYAALPDDLRGAVGVIVANAPYVPTGEIGLMPPEARDHEARIALDGGPDGLDVQRRIAAAAGRWLTPRGVVVLETSRRQAPASVRLLAEAGFRASAVTDDERAATAVVAVRESRGAPAGPRDRG
ncbi:MAG: prmB [Naasia sp.]|nr:prmB [Naasia sp.]